MIPPSGILIDENLPTPLGLSFPGIVLHARDLGPSRTDTQLRTVARERRLVILTKDTDFYDRMLLASPPPWVVKLECGNLRRRPLLSLLREQWPHVLQLLPEHKLIRVLSHAVEGVA